MTRHLLAIAVGSLLGAALGAAAFVFSLRYERDIGDQGIML